jgi:hypothetical protein
VIFVTAFDQYAVSGLSQSECRRLPAETRFSCSTHRSQYSVSGSGPQSVTGPTRRLQADDMALIPLGNSGFFTQVRDILVIEAQNHSFTGDSGFRQNLSCPQTASRMGTGFAIGPVSAHRSLGPCEPRPILWKSVLHPAGGTLVLGNRRADVSDGASCRSPESNSCYEKASLRSGRAAATD